MDMSAIIEQSRTQSIQRQPDYRDQAGGLNVVWLARAGLQISPWWSPQRDTELGNFWKKPDHLAGSVYTLEARMTSIPFRIEARDPSISEHVKQAEQLTRVLEDTPQYGEGWGTFYSKFIEDYLTCDNGAFAEVIGMGSKTGPVTGRPLTVAHLDSSRCTRTGNAEYPVLFRDTDGKLYKLHYTRVMFAAQMSSPKKEMLGVGLCCVSRCVNVAQTLLDILTYKQEKLGSRPHRAILITKGGLDPNDIRSAFQLAESATDSQGFARYSKIVVAGSSSLPESALDIVELSELPDGFNEETSTIMGMATIALAFGVDARELFPAMQSGATRAEALLQHLKQRGKGPGQIIQTTEMLFNQKWLPSHLVMVFDFQDDAQDRQIADIRKVRADRRVQDNTTGAMNSRLMREQMVETGDLNRSQFERLELVDGRLPDGMSVLSLFYSRDPVMKKYLNVGAQDPLDVEANEPEAIFEMVQERLTEINEDMVNTHNSELRYKGMQAQSALIYLRQHYLDPINTLPNTMGYAQAQPPQMMQAQAGQQPQGEGGTGKGNRVDKRLRTQNLMFPNVPVETNENEYPPEEAQEESEEKVE